ncbi:hypothetical protein [Niastella populi]|uniref:hypothetical protein n=1 Tax=Niastella populi TaxID=550983 RepID=UPI0013FE0197|nr:hypothetical protein [Niastella populi]
MAAYKSALEQLRDRGLISQDGDGYMVTDKGYHYGRAYHIDSVLGAGEIVG